jgi:hypothetical protein
VEVTMKKMKLEMYQPNLQSKEQQPLTRKTRKRMGMGTEKSRRRSKVLLSHQQERQQQKKHLRMRAGTMKRLL